MQLDNPAFYSDSDISNHFPNNKRGVYLPPSSLTTASTKQLYNNNKSHHLHHHHYYEPIIPSLTLDSRKQHQHQHQRLRNEIIVSASTLPSFPPQKRQSLGLFWEMGMQDVDSRIEKKSKNRTTISCLSLFIICLAVIVIGVSALTFNIGESNSNSSFSNVAFYFFQKFPSNYFHKENHYKSSKLIFIK